MTLLTGDAGRAWTRRDRVLAAALQIHEDGLCPCGCGWHRDLAWNPDMDGHFEVNDQVICYARAAMERWREDHKGGEGVEPGTLPRVVNIMPAGQSPAPWVPPK